MAVLLTAAAFLVLVLIRQEMFAVDSGRQLDVSQVQAGVRQILTDPIDGYGRTDVTEIRCNNGANPTIRAGASFTCQVRVNGAERQVTVAFPDDSGTYEVDRPR